ncbi:MAG: NAD(P)/FAD-dependent oxidoreductase [Solirubrobacterales bacterium]|nr:NAD(P)/FAD-dependent oxidoreductase [Solirubrobacterales bacterium]
MLVCGASFAGLTVARELSGSGARVLIIDRYEVGERQTSACAAPTEWLTNMGLDDAILQTFEDLVIHRGQEKGGRRATKTYRWRLPWTFSTFDYRRICALLKDQSPDIPFETAKVDGITRGATLHTVHTDRGDLRASLVVDALGWRRVLSSSPDAIQPPNARLSRGLEVHPEVADAQDRDLEIWLDCECIRPGYGWSFPAKDEVRVGVGSFDPNIKVKRPTVDLARDLGVATDGYQGNWIPHVLRPAVEDDVFFVGDSAGHCLPTTAEGIRTALYFGLAAGRELRAVVDGRQSRGQALTRYGSFSDDHSWSFKWMWRVQSLFSWANKLPLMDAVLDVMDRPAFIRWSFDHYLRIAPPSYALQPSWPDARAAVAAPTAVPALA